MSISSTALIPYAPPMTPMELNSTITQQQTASRQSISPFHSSQVLSFGLFGQETAQKMADALESHSLQLIYNNKTTKFTVLESSSLTKETIEKIFSEKSYHGWKPQALDEVDQFGNRLVQLRDIAAPHGWFENFRQIKLQNLSSIMLA